MANLGVDKLSTSERYKRAIAAVLDKGWTHQKAATHYRINRSHLSTRVRAAREEREEKIRLAREAEEARAFKVEKVLDRKFSMSQEEFYDRYFGHIICPDCDVHHPDPPFHREMREAIQGPSRRILINVPPFHSKSTEVTVKDTIFDICKNPDLRTIIVSKNQEFASKFVNQIQMFLTDEWQYEGAAGNLIEEWGPFRAEGKDARWNTREFYVANRRSAEKDPTVLALGVGSQIYGRRADKIKFDDIADVANQRNPDRVAQMLEWINKDALSRIGKKGKAIWVGTRVSAGDIYSHLMHQPGYKVIRYPLIVDEGEELVLWPDHFPYEQALIHRGEMGAAEFQLIYQNVDMPGTGASFTEDLLKSCYDETRVLGHYEDSWRLVAGLDPAGASKDSGYTAFTLLGVDLQTGCRYLVDQVAVKSMKAPQMFDQMWEWTERYPLHEWRVEVNGLQAQLFQYNRELVQEMARRGVRITPHKTGTNKWDPQFGVESMAPLMSGGLFNIPWGNDPTRAKLGPFIAELLQFPMGQLQDRIMATWFASIGVRELVGRAHLPMFNSRQRVPDRIRRRRHVVSFDQRSVAPVSLRSQRPGHLMRSAQERLTLGRPVAHDEVKEFEPEPPPRPVNVPAGIFNEDA